MSLCCLFFPLRVHISRVSLCRRLSILFEFMEYTYCTFDLKYGDVTTIIGIVMESTTLLWPIFFFFWEVRLYYDGYRRGYRKLGTDTMEF
jgi:hypothetical protein